MLRNMKRRLIATFVCRFKGHDFGSVIYISPSVLTFCRRCREELQGRTFADLEPMTDEDREHLEHLDAMEFGDG